MRTAWWLNKNADIESYSSERQHRRHASHWENKTRFGKRRKRHSCGGENHVTNPSDAGELRREQCTRRQASSLLVSRWQHFVEVQLSQWLSASHSLHTIKFNTSGEITTLLAGGNLLYQGCLQLPLCYTEVHVLLLSCRGELKHFIIFRFVTGRFNCSSTGF